MKKILFLHPKTPQSKTLISHLTMMKSTLIHKNQTFTLTLIKQQHHRTLTTTSSKTSLNPNPNTIQDNNTFTISYLINSCKFPLEKAISASKYLNFKTPNKPDSVIQFFKTQGFSDTQISQLIRKFPVALSCNPQKNLLPKFKFLSSIGLSDADIVKLLVARPKSLGRSLDNHIVPSVELLNNLLQSNERTLIAIRRCAWVLDWDFRSNLIPNMEFLRDVGVPGDKMLYMLTYQPRDFLVSGEVFRKAVEEVVGMGFHPSKTHFMLAVHAIRSMSKGTWDKKIETYEKWGWRKEEVLLAFRSDPWCMMKSEEKIGTVMEFLVNTMGVELSVVVKNSVLISLSMEKRIVPRSLVYKYCVDKKLIDKNQVGLCWWLKCPETYFVKRLERYDKYVPGVLEFYREKMDQKNLV